MKKFFRAAPLIIGACVAAIGITACGNSKETDPGPTVALSEIDKDYSIGIIRDGLYTSSFFDLKFINPENWTMTSSEDLKKLGEAAGDSDRSSLALQSVSRQKDANITVRITNLGLDTRTRSQSDIIDSIYSSLEKNKKSGRSVYSDMTLNKVEVDFLGEKVPALKMHGKIGAKDIYQTQVVLLKGSYYAHIISTATSEDSSVKNLGSFASIN